MKDERRAWVPVLIAEDGSLWPYWDLAALARGHAIDKLAVATAYKSVQSAKEAGIILMRCVVEVPARKGKRR